MVLLVATLRKKHPLPCGTGYGGRTNRIGRREGRPLRTSQVTQKAEGGTCDRDEQCPDPGYGEFLGGGAPDGRIPHSNDKYLSQDRRTAVLERMLPLFAPAAGHGSGGGGDRDRPQEAPRGGAAEERAPPLHDPRVDSLITAVGTLQQRFDHMASSNEAKLDRIFALLTGGPREA